MSAEELGPEGEKLTGLSKIFNSHTNRGRANVSTNNEISFITLKH